jgi:hypothetical protein
MLGPATAVSCVCAAFFRRGFALVCSGAAPRIALHRCPQLIRREVVLFWKSVEANEKHAIAFDLEHLRRVPLAVAGPKGLDAVVVIES